MRAGTKTFEIFYAYAHEDEELRNELEKHLMSLQQQGLISQWHDRKIAAGTQWAQAIDTHLDVAHIILLLISPAFLASKYCYHHEMQRAIERAQTGKARMIPILLRPCDWQHTPLASFQMLPTDAVAVTSWPNRDEAFLDVSRGLRTVLDEMIASIAQDRNVAFTPPPVPLTSLIGRDKEIDTISTMLSRESVRLLTLTGTGGVGKTRLALSVAASLREAFTDGICFVDLSTTSNPNSVLPAIAQAFRMPTSSQQISEIVQDFLREKFLLLVLDNFEQVVEAAPQVTNLLATCPSLKVLVTSRETLRVSGEYEFCVPPLALPDLKMPPHEIVLAHNASVELFIQRVQHCTPDFALTEANVRTIAEICHRLDGLPLALELAAARIKLLTTSDLLKRLTGCLPRFSAGYRDAPARHQTLQDTIKWSYDLLSGAEQMLFRRFCIFVGGCELSTIEALSAVLGDERASILDDIESLLNKSLIRRVGQKDGQPRFLLLETIRAFGLECSETLGEREKVGQAHAQHYLTWAQAACTSIFGHEQMRWMRDFVQELDNLRSAMRFFLEQRDKQSALSLGAHLSPIWFLWGWTNQSIYMIEGKQFLEEVLAGEEMETWAYGRSLTVYGGILSVLRETDQGVRRCEQALSLFRRMGDLQGIIQALWMSFYAWFMQGNFRKARQVTEEALMLSQQHPEVCTEWGATWTQAHSSFLAGYVAVWDGRPEEARDLLLNSETLAEEAGDAFIKAKAALARCEAAVFAGKDEQARVLLEQSLPSFEGLRMTVLVAEAMSLQGFLALRARKVNQARLLLSESLLVAKKARDERQVAWSLIWLARVELDERNPDEACRLLTDALRWAKSKDDRVMLALGLEGLGNVVAVQGEPIWAARLWGAAEMLREAMGIPLPPVEHPEYEERIAAVRAMLDEVSFGTTWAEGRNMSSEQIFTLIGFSLSASAPTTFLG